MLDIVKPVADVQSRHDSRGIAIDKVGIRNIRHPVRVTDRNAGEQHTVARVNMYVGLPHHARGTHMSRFVDIINRHEHGLSMQSFVQMLSEMTAITGAGSGYIEMRFPYFVNKIAPVTGVRSLLDYEVAFIGEIHGNETLLTAQVKVPVTSLCPCSREISDYGAHNQRSFITVTAILRDHIWIEDLIDMIEPEASCELYGLLKRPDEKYVTEHAYDNPKFVEDIVRDVARRLDTERRIADYVVESENFESIHNHSAYAMVTSARGN